MAKVAKLLAVGASKNEQSKPRGVDTVSTLSQGHNPRRVGMHCVKNLKTGVDVNICVPTGTFVGGTPLFAAAQEGR